MFMSEMMIAISEPHYYFLHGGDKSIPHHMVVYSYTNEEFFNEEWKDDYNLAFRESFRRITNVAFEHDIIYCYNSKFTRFFSLNLVEIYEDQVGRQLCILHTYKLNIFKRIWRKKHRIIFQNRQL